MENRLWIRDSNEIHVLSAVIAARPRPKLAVIAIPLEEGAGAPGESAVDDDTLATGGSGGSTTSATSRGGLGGFAGDNAMGGTCLSSAPGSAGMMAISPLRSTHGLPAAPKPNNIGSKLHHGIRIEIEWKGDKLISQNKDVALPKALVTESTMSRPFFDARVPLVASILSKRAYNLSWRKTDTPLVGVLKD
ncbi:hypothetical protein QQP08_025826 [Theobroma cacao]|nr:hypothetical protein QQP08_025826 [Theobroma cacao]